MDCGGERDFERENEPKLLRRWTFEIGVEDGPAWHVGNCYETGFGELRGVHGKPGYVGDRELPEKVRSTGLICRNSSEGNGVVFSWLDYDLDRLPFVHRAIAVRHGVETYDLIEDAAGRDVPFENIRK